MPNGTDWRSARGWRNQWKRDFLLIVSSSTVSAVIVHFLQAAQIASLQQENQVLRAQVTSMGGKPYVASSKIIVVESR